MNKSNYGRSRGLLLFQNIFVRKERLSLKLIEVKFHMDVSRFRDRTAIAYRASWQNSPVVLQRKWNCTGNFWSAFFQEVWRTYSHLGELSPTN